MRENDRLIVNELHPEDMTALKRLFARDAQMKVLGLDGWTALKSLLPPKERRGVVLVDPAYEEPGELERLVQGLKDAARRFAGGTILLWYPIKDLRAAVALRRQIAGPRARQGAGGRADDPRAPKTLRASTAPGSSSPIRRLRSPAKLQALLPAAGARVGTRRGRNVAHGGACPRPARLVAGSG